MGVPRKPAHLSLVTPEDLESQRRWIAERTDIPPAKFPPSEPCTLLWWRDQCCSVALFFGGIGIFAGFCYIAYLMFNFVM